MNRHFLATLPLLILSLPLRADDPPQDPDWTHVVRRAPRRHNLSVNYEEGVLYISDRSCSSGTVTIIVTDLNTGVETEYIVTLTDGEIQLPLNLPAGEYDLMVSNEKETISTTLYI